MVQIKALRKLADPPDRLGSSEHFHGDVSQIKALRKLADVPAPFFSSSARFCVGLAKVSQIKAVCGSSGARVVDLHQVATFSQHLSQIKALYGILQGALVFCVNFRRRQSNKGAVRSSGPVVCRKPRPGLTSRRGSRLFRKSRSQAKGIWRHACSGARPVDFGKSLSFFPGC